MKRKLISLAAVCAVLASSVGTAALAAAPSDYDGQSYESLGYTSSDSDGQINLAVIAKGNVKIYGDAMYIEGSVYSNGTIYGGNGAGNSIEGLLISGTENQTETGANNLEVVRYGYVHVDDEGNTDTTNAYSVGLGTNGAILDKETSFDYSYEEYEYPEISNYVESAIANEYSSVLTVTEDTHFGTVDNANGAGLIIDASNGDVNVVIDTLNVSSNPYIRTIGEGHVNLYVKNWVSNNNVNLELMHVSDVNNIKSWDTAAQWAYISNSIYTTEYNVVSHGYYYGVPRPNETVLSELDPNKIDFYIDKMNGSDEVALNGCRIAANVHSNASSLSIGNSLEIYGNVTSGATLFETKGSGYINGTVTVPNAASTVYNSSCIQGQLITDTLLINGAGAILNQTDTITIADDSEDEDDSNSSDSQYKLDIIEDVVYVVVGEDIPAFTLDKNVNYKWKISNSNVYFSSNSLGENIYSPGYLTADDVTFAYGHNSWWSSMSAGDEVTVKAVSYDDDSLYDTAKIIFVASEDDIPKATEAPTAESTEEPAATETPSLPSGGEEISLKGVDYAYIFGYEPDYKEDADGNVTASVRMAPDDTVTREQVCAMIMRLLDQKYGTMDNRYSMTNNIAQYDGQWFARGLAYMASKGTFDGIDKVDTGNVTRGEVAKLIAFGLNLSETADVSYTDAQDSQYLPYIKMMKYYGYMEGRDDRTFGTDDTMTRGEFCTLFNRITGRDDASKYRLVAVDADGNEVDVTPETYYFSDLAGNMYEDACLRATSSFNGDGKVDLSIRLANIRNVLDNYNSQKKY